MTPEKITIFAWSFSAKHQYIIFDIEWKVNDNNPTAKSDIIFAPQKITYGVSFVCAEIRAKEDPTLAAWFQMRPTFFF